MNDRSQLKKYIELIACAMRQDSIAMTTAAGSGHPTSALSAVDIIATLFLYAMKFDPDNFDNPDNDKFILSKGHASPALYAMWHQLGKISDQELMTYRQFSSTLEGHATPRFAYTTVATGSLGMGLSMGAGQALTALKDGRSYKVFVLLGDGETAEGQIWEAAEIAAHYKLSNLNAIVDCNRLGQSEPTMDEWHVQRYAAKFSAFGWKTAIVDGHDVGQLMDVYDKALDSSAQPMVIIAKTIKGKGIEQIENKQGFHGKSFSRQQADEYLMPLKQLYTTIHKELASTYKWQPTISKSMRGVLSNASLQNVGTAPNYVVGQKIATRKVYGQALAACGDLLPTLLCLDGDVKNSTFADIFEHAHPDRFIQCYVAEQNMVGMAIGMARIGFIPFVSTFGAFFSRAYDQIRMAAINRAPLRLCGSHAGVSIGEDGPSQMALEDIAMMNAIPDSVILYPSDGVSTWALVQEMSNYNKGISYVRTTREDTPVIYPVDEKFHIGGCKILRNSTQDVVCVIGAGITLHQALQAYTTLIQEDIHISVIDLYSIKPFDIEKVRATIKNSYSRCITVEDHYIPGGIGNIIAAQLCDDAINFTMLGVTHIPRSGKPEKLRAWAGIDAASIVKTVKSLL